MDARELLSDDAEPVANTDSGASGKPADGVTPKAEVSASADTESVTDENDGDQEHDPEDIQGLKKALKAVRGDKRTLRKQYGDVEKEVKRLAEELKRRDAEMASVRGRTAFFEQQIRSQQAAQSTPTPEDDESLFYSNPVEYIKKRDERILQQYQEAQNSERLKILRRQEAKMSSKYTDYEEVSAFFKQELATKPHYEAYIAESMEHDDPFEFLYQKAKYLKGGGEASLVKEIEALKNELAQLKGGQTSQPQAQKPQIPKPSLANEPGNGASASAKWPSPMTVKELLA